MVQARLNHGSTRVNLATGWPVPRAACCPLLVLLALTPASALAAGALGIFTNQGDIGAVARAGSAIYRPENDTYTVTGGGENMWFTSDAFHFVWREASGDLKFRSDIRWVGTSTQPHRKACLMIRQSLDPGSVYADAVIHGDGLTSLQYRETEKANTREIQANVSGPLRLGIEKRGDYVSLLIATGSGPLQLAGGSFRIKLHDPFYVGLAVCSHDNKTLEQAIFSNVAITPISPSPGDTGLPLVSTLETVPVASLDRRVVYHTTNHIEAPNWSRDGQFLFFNCNGRIYRIPARGGEPQLIDTGPAVRCNNDHGLSPDGTRLAISDQSAPDHLSRISILPSSGGIPALVTSNAPSYWHGWSPDGRTLAYCAEREGEFDIYTTVLPGGNETRLTTTPGLDDGPDYSPDGRYIYFNSERTGHMQIWRMKTDGTEQTQITGDAFNNWFPHPSPDGRWIAFLSYDQDVQGHPANKDVMLRLMPTRGGPVQIVAKLLGGQGTMNVPSWSPDSQHIAFVSYQFIYP